MTEQTGRIVRLVGAALVLVALYFIARAYGFDAYTDPERLRALVASSGPWGALVFVGVVIIAVVAQIPAFALILLAPALFSFWQAWGVSFVASYVAVIVNFELVRKLGGQPLARVEKPWLKRIFALLDEHPIGAIVVLRIVTIMLPPVTSALALTSVKSGHHALASLLGLVVPITLLVLAGALMLG